MQQLIAAIFGNSADVSAISPDTRDYIADLMNRAYLNLHGTPLATADLQWASAMVAAGLQLYKDPRMASFGTRELVQLFENVIRISEEHVKVSKRHASMALNVFYLKETALDTLGQEDAQKAHHAASTVIGTQTTYTGRISNRPLPHSN